MQKAFQRLLSARPALRPLEAVNGSKHRPSLVQDKPQICQSGLRAHHRRSGRQAIPPLLSRSFRASTARRDILFVSIPAFKASLLAITRITLVTLPFWWRWRLFKRFPAATRLLLQIPLLACVVVLALGIDQSPHTARWRLLLMSEREEFEWSQARFESIMAEHPQVLKSDDERVVLVKQVCDRLIAALAAMDTPCVSASGFLRVTDEMSEKMRKTPVQPSARTKTAHMPFKPPSSNPNKVLSESSWDIYVIDSPEINAFVLPTKELFVNTGLIDLLNKDEQLIAAVLSHEISHVMERHAVENMGFYTLSSVAFDVVRGISWALTLSFPFLQDAMASAINFTNDTLASRAYSRKLEIEADKLGLQVMARAGYNPHNATQLWSFLHEVEDETTKASEEFCLHNSALMRTHPLGDDRIKAVTQDMPQAMKLFDRSDKAPIATAKKARGAEAPTS